MKSHNILVPPMWGGSSLLNGYQCPCIPVRYKGYNLQTGFQERKFCHPIMEIAGLGLGKHFVDNAPSVGVLRCSKNPVDARECFFQQRAKSLSLAGASVAVATRVESSRVGDQSRSTRNLSKHFLLFSLFRRSKIEHGISGDLPDLGSRISDMQGASRSVF